MDNKLTWVEGGIISVAIAGGLAIFLPQIVSATQEIPKDKIGDAATWFGAGFSGLAFFGAIGLAWQRNGADKQAALRRAYVVAASVSLHLLRLIQAVDNAASLLEFEDESNFQTRNQTIEIVTRVQNIAISSDDLGALTVLEGKDAFRLALSITLLDSLKADMLDEQIRDKRDRVLMEYEIASYIQRLNRIARLARVVTANFLKITDKQAPHPNDDEVWGDAEDF
jgi:hypothetical protein